MGISGLLPFLEKASEHINVKTLANSTVAIDSYCWLHKGAFGVGDKLVRGEETDVHIMYCLKYVNMLLSYNIKPILVFDGRHLKAKAETEAKRRDARKNAKQQGLELMRQGKHKEAQTYLRRCVDITHEMALKLIKQCRELNVDCVVAPYEADAQLAYLNKIGLADYVITEDSDLTLFGCRKILFKLDLAGWCTLVDADKLHLAMNCNIEKFTMDKFRLMCVLSGCDYVPSLPGIGLAKACKFVMKTEETDLMRALDKIPAYLNMRNLTVTEEYKVNVMKAIATFVHMVVYDPRRRKQVRLNEIDEIGTDLELCTNAGELMSDDKTALDLAVGNLNPFNLKRLDNWHPDKTLQPTNKKSVLTKGLKASKHPSIWKQDYRWSTAVKTSSSTGTMYGFVTVPKKSSSDPTFNRQPKRSIQFIDDSDDDGSSPENDDNLLGQYVSVPEPQQKRFKDESDAESIDSSGDCNQENDTEEGKLTKATTPRRNPFKKQVQQDDGLLSPTKITNENSSLVRNQSPVKRIDFNRLQKLSKFCRTEVDKQHVISQFFTPATISRELSMGADGNVEESENVSTDNESDTIVPAFVYLNASTESAESFTMQSTASKSTTDFTDNQAISILEQFKYSQKESMNGRLESDKMLTDSQETIDETDSDTNQLPIDISDDSNNDALIDKGLNIQQAPSSSRTTKPAKATGRKAVSTRKLSQSKSTSVSSSTQSRLSMFGFQKKPVIQK